MTNPNNKALLDDLLADELLAAEPVKAEGKPPARAVLKPRAAATPVPMASEAPVAEPTFPGGGIITPGPVVTAEPTPDQLRIKELEHSLAVARTDALDRKLVTVDEPVYTQPPPPQSASDLIHIVANDFTVLGATWFRGQEINIGPQGSYAATLDRTGKSWTTMTDEEQWDRFGEVKFHPGPWRGQSWQEQSAAKLEAARRGGVPQL